MPDLITNSKDFQEWPRAYSDERHSQYEFPIEICSKSTHQKYLKEVENFHNFKAKKFFKTQIKKLAKIALIKESRPIKGFEKILNKKSSIEKLVKSKENYNNEEEKNIHIELEDKRIKLIQYNEKNNHLENNDKLIQEQKDEGFSKLFLEEMPFNKVETFEPFSIKCQICSSKKEDYHNLGCEDNFCTSCIYLLLENYITTSFVFPEEILCPVCFSTIPDPLISKFSSKSLYCKMLELREKQTIQKLVSEKKALYYCPIPKCEGFGHLFPDEKITACINASVQSAPTVKGPCIHV